MAHGPNPDVVRSTDRLANRRAIPLYIRAT